MLSHAPFRMEKNVNINISVVGQKLRLPTNLKIIVDGTHEFIRFVFNLDEDWNGLTTYAQFTQDGKSYNVYLDDNSSVFLPHEITEGVCSLTLSGTGNGVIATTDYVEFIVVDNILTAGESSTEITESLYEQLIDKINSMQGEYDETSSAYAYLVDQNTILVNRVNILDGKISDEVASRIDLGSTLQTSVDDIETRLNNEVDSRVSADNTITNTISEVQASVSTERNIREREDAAINSRIDSIAAIQEGSTTGDIELQDIRVGYDGTQYASAGTAVRTQVANVNDRVNENSESISSMSTTVNDLSSAIDYKVDGAYVEDGVAYFTSNNNVLFSITGIGGGGGGGGETSSTLVLQNLTGWITKTISSNNDCVLSFSWSSTMDGFDTGAGTLSVQIRGVNVLTRAVDQGWFSVDITRYLQSGSNRVRVSVTDAYGTTKSILFTVTVISLNITSTFDQGLVRTGSFDIPYVVVGAGNKYVHFILDGTEVATDLVQTSGRQSSHVFNKLSHGEHNIEIYATSTEDGEDVESNHLYLSMMSVDDGDNTPIISSSFNSATARQYENIVIPYYVYDPLSYTSDISIYANDELYSSQVVDRTEQTISYRAKDYGRLEIEIRYKGIVKSFNINIEQSDSSLIPITQDLELYLSADGRSNNEANPGVWTYQGISSDFNDFNFVSDGWIHDVDGNMALRVTGNAKLSINYLMFSEDSRSRGRTIEFEFETSSVLDYDSEIIRCWNNNRGIKFTAQKATIASEQTSISTQYKEDEHVRVSFVVNPSKNGRLLLVYINGVLSGATTYAEKDDFSQPVPVNIEIGSTDCTVDIYNIRVYGHALSAEEIVTNWIADTQDVNLMLERYERNDIRDNGEISIDRLPINLPYLLIECEELSQNKKDEKIVSGRFVDRLNPSRSFTYEDAKCTVQGTSSQGYPRKNYKIKFKNFTDNNGDVSSSYYLRGPENSIPSSVFCFKADYASSEGANNVELVRLYEDSCPVKTEAQKADTTGLVRQGIDGVPIVIFWYKPSTGVTTFMGKYNFNFDKSSPVFGFKDGDESWETTDNSNKWALFKEADYDGDEWLNAFEARYPDTKPAYEDSTELAKVAKWINSTDTEAAAYEKREITEDKIVFDKGGHPLSGDSMQYIEAGPDSAFSLLCVIKTPVRTFTKPKDASAEYSFPGITIRNYGGESFVSSDLDKEENKDQYTAGLCIDPNNNVVIGRNDAYDFISNNSDEANFGVYQSTDVGDHNEFYFEIPVVKDDLDYYCVYWNNDDSTMPVDINPGDIIYAGKNTPYYWIKNVNNGPKVDFDTPVVYTETYENGKTSEFKYYFDNPEYRVAKFRFELENWFNKEDVLFYYLFTELFLMIDSRVKNSFPTKFGSTAGAKWMWLPYDMDTAIGINNEGALVFDYSLEDTDMLSSIAGVYNGYKTVMWNNVRDAFPKELSEMYQRMRSGGVLSYDVVEDRFEDHQGVWSETVFNEDAYYKYIQPFINSGENNLKMCLGSKAEQRKWWLYNRFRYIDSKYSSGYAMSSYIQARVYQKADLTITPYASIYASASFDSNVVKKRASRNTAVVLKSPSTWDPGGSDAVLRINSADQLASVGDLSPFYIGDISFASAVKIKEIKIGDGRSSYRNENLQGLELGNNTLLKTLDVRNCPKLTTPIDVSGCTNIEEIYFDGTSITGINLPNGGVITKLHLPSTVTNLTIINQPNITDFVLNSYSQISTLWIEHTSINELPILMGMENNGRVRLIDVNWETDTYEEAVALVEKLDTSRGIDAYGNNTQNAQVSGTYHAKIISDYTIELLQTNYPDLTVTYDEIQGHNWMLNQYILDEIDDYNFETLTKLTGYAFCNKHGNLYLPEVTSAVGDSIFENFVSSDFSLKTTLPKLTTIGGYYVFRNASLTELDSTSLKTLEPIYSPLMFSNNNIKYVHLPNLIYGYADRRGFITGNSNVEYVIIPTWDGQAPHPDGSETLKYIEIHGDTVPNGYPCDVNLGENNIWRHFVIRKNNGVSPARVSSSSKNPLSGYPSGACLNVYVARALIESYKTATNWSSWYAQGRVDFKALEDYTVDGTATGKFDYEKIGLEVYHIVN